MLRKILKLSAARVQLCFFVGLMFCAGVHADTIDKLSDLEGFYVLKVKTIDGWMDKDKKQKTKNKKSLVLRGVIGTESSFLTMALLQHVAPTVTAIHTVPKPLFSSNP
jgi:hypothetical protein